MTWADWVDYLRIGFKIYLACMGVALFVWIRKAELED